VQISIAKVNMDREPMIIFLTDVQAVPRIGEFLKYDDMMHKVISVIHTLNNHGITVTIERT
jgi:hypothetical protein